MVNIDEFIEVVKEELIKKGITYIPNPQQAAKFAAELVTKEQSTIRDSIAHSSQTSRNDDDLHVDSPNGSSCQEFNDNFETMDAHSGE